MQYIYNHILLYSVFLTFEMCFIMISNKRIYHVACFLIVVLFFSCARNPVTGKKELMLMSEKQEINLGKQSDPSIVASFGLYEDKKLQNFIDQKGQQMAKVSHRPDLNYEFKVLDTDVINAFALPGGYVYFTRGILAHFNNEAEFAGVLGHEIGHITARHSAKQYSKQMLAQVGLLAGVIVSQDFRQYAGAAQQGLGLLFLKFGRDNESESDKLGVEYSTRIGYDAHHMANFFQTLHRMRASSGSEPIPNFLSTHPDPVDREKNVHALADEWQKKLNKNRKNLKENRESYLQMIDGIIYGKDPRQGFTEQGVFYHPEMKFFFSVPSGWKVVNSPAQVQMAPDAGDAVLILELVSGKSAVTAAQEYVQQNKIKVIQAENTSVNSLSAREVLGEVVNQNDANNPISILSYFIEYQNRVFAFHGMAYRNTFSKYRNLMDRSIRTFNKLRDQNKINVSPDRIKIVKNTKSQSLRSALLSSGVSSSKLTEHSIINGLDLEAQVSSGSYYKIVQYNKAP